MNFFDHAQLKSVTKRNIPTENKVDGMFIARMSMVFLCLKRNALICHMSNEYENNKKHLTHVDGSREN